MRLTARRAAPTSRACVSDRPKREICLVLSLSLCACSGGLPRPSDKNVNLTGTVYLGGTERRGDPLEGATITVTRASNGQQLATATSSLTGGYRLSFAAEADTRVVIAFRSSNLVPNFRGLFVGPFIRSPAVRCARNGRSNQVY